MPISISLGVGNLQRRLMLQEHGMISGMEEATDASVRGLEWLEVCGCDTPAP